MSKVYRIIALCAVVMLALRVQADIVLPDILSDHMVLQQQTEVQLWGKAEAGNTVTVYASWGQKAETRVRKDGSWLVSIHTPQGSYVPQTLTFVETPQRRQYYAPEPVYRRDILIGEVWMGSGQSNMEMPLRGFWQCPVRDANRDIALSGTYRGKVRYAVVERRAAMTPQEFAYGSWMECEPANAPRFGATAYYFACMLQQVLDVPVGIINCSWGGSRVEGWMPREILSTYPDVDLSEAGLNAYKDDWMRPLVMYNGMLYPLRHYTLRGWLWYQGCSNIGHADVYAQREAEMVRHWRKLWGKQLPFYFVEIAPHRHGDADATWAAELREAQWQLPQLLPNSAGVSTNDLVSDYEIDNIHPAEKRTIGERLAYLALHRDYALHEVACYSPQYERCELRDTAIVVYFTHAEDGFSRYHDIRGFEVAGADGVFHPAEARECPEAKNALILTPLHPSAISHHQPLTAARYCFRNFQLGNLANLRGLPIVPFRTEPQSINHQSPISNHPYYIGTNLWYGAILASQGRGGDRARLCRELDTLQSLGITNLRVLVGADGRSGVQAKVEPTLQIEPGVYNDTLLDGLDYLLYQLEQRGMQAVLFINNAWEWSGGYSQYLSWAKHMHWPTPQEVGYPQYMASCAEWSRSREAQALFYDHVRAIVGRTNRYTGRPYTESPAIYSWQIANEPRAFSLDVADEFAEWIHTSAQLIKQLDPNHRVSTGSEGIWGCEMSAELCQRIHAYPEVDYITCHIWPYNWGWLDADHMDQTIDSAILKTRDYIRQHLRIAEALHKPLVIEEFGFPRDVPMWTDSVCRPTTDRYREQYYRAVFDAVRQSAQEGGWLIGCNFWGWGGEAVPRHRQWQPGDPYTGDPAQEDQGLNSVFLSDHDMLNLIRQY